MGLWLSASGAERLCALGATWRFWAAPHFHVRGTCSGEVPNDTPAHEHRCQRSLCLRGYCLCSFGAGPSVPISALGITVPLAAADASALRRCVIGSNLRRWLR
jgi:hypothetical protein